MRLRFHSLLFLLLLLTACTIPASGGPGVTPSFPVVPAAPTVTITTALPTPEEVPITLIPLAGPVSKAEAEISGLAWFSDTLVLLPQYPARFGKGDGVLFAIPQAELVAYLKGENTQPIRPAEIPLVAPGAAKLAGFEGFESIAFAGNRVFLTIEANLGKMVAYLVGGDVAAGMGQITLDIEHRARIEAQTGISNLSDEALLVAGERLVTFYEANGAEVNERPIAHVFDFNLVPQENLAFPNLEYRLTDATALDAAGRFWVINYFYPGDVSLKPEHDPLAETYGLGVTHAQSDGVERLVEYQFTEGGLARTDSFPIWLTLDKEARNWEGLVRLETAGVPSGFLLATDKYPATLLAYIPFPEKK
jgi:hypothetical protein